MNCQSGTGSGCHNDERPATLLIIYPTGYQEPTCDACARYWVNLRPTETRLAPLSAYVDHFAQAKAALSAPRAIPQSPVIQARVEAPTATPGPRAAITAAPKARHMGRWLTGSALASIVLGIVIIAVTIQHNSQVNPMGDPPGAPILWGVFLIVAPIVIAIIWFVCLLFSRAFAEHRRWLNQFTPEQQAAIRTAEQAAVAVGAYALHRKMKATNRRMAARNSASVIGDNFRR